MVKNKLKDNHSVQMPKEGNYSTGVKERNNSPENIKIAGIIFFLANCLGGFGIIFITIMYLINAHKFSTTDKRAYFEMFNFYISYLAYFCFICALIVGVSSLIGYPFIFGFNLSTTILFSLLSLLLITGFLTMIMGLFEHISGKPYKYFLSISFVKI